MENIHMLNLEAETVPLLIDVLKKTDIKVPFVTNGRIAKHRERYLMARFLATVAKTQLIQYPIIVKHQDKPDFILEFGFHRVGVECVEAVPQDWYEVQAIRERTYPEAINFSPEYKIGESSLSLQEKNDLASGNSNGHIWMGSSPEITWAKTIAYFIRVKTEKLRSGHYVGFSSVWLLIQEECRAPVHDEDQIREAANLCLPMIECFLTSTGFNEIFICSNKWLLSFKAESYSVEPIIDLWGDT